MSSHTIEKPARSAVEDLRPYGHDYERLCQIVRGEKSYVMMLSEDSPSRKVNVYPGYSVIIRARFQDNLTMVFHPNSLAIKTICN